MRRATSPLLLLLPGVLLLIPEPARAQQMPAIARFAQVRVHLLDRTIIAGEFDAFDRNELVLGASPYAPKQRIVLDSVASIDMRHRVSFLKRMGETTLLGVMVGAAAGTGFSFLMGSPEDGGIGLTGPLLIGALGGGMAATALGSGYRWTEAYRRTP